MKNILLFTSLIFSISCSQDARILSSDGSKQLSYCGSDKWIVCVNENCPNGYSIVVHFAAINGELSIIKCK